MPGGPPGLSFNPGFCDMKQIGVLLNPLDGTLVQIRFSHCSQSSFPDNVAGTHLYTWVEWGSVEVKSFAWEHFAQAKARTWKQNLSIPSQAHALHCATASPFIMAWMTWKYDCILFIDKNAPLFVILLSCEVLPQWKHFKLLLEFGGQ